MCSRRPKSWTGRSIAPLGRRQIRSQINQRISIQTWWIHGCQRNKDQYNTIMYRNRIHCCFFGQTRASLIKTGPRPISDLHIGVYKYFSGARWVYISTSPAPEKCINISPAPERCFQILPRLFRCGEVYLNISPAPLKYYLSDTSPAPCRECPIWGANIHVSKALRLD